MSYRGFRERVFYVLNASFVLICVSQAIQEPRKILTLDLKCCQLHRYQHVCCQDSKQVGRPSASLCKSWEVQVTQVNVLWQCHRPVMPSLSVQPRQHGQHILTGRCRAISTTSVWTYFRQGGTSGCVTIGGDKTSCAASWHKSGNTPLTWWRHVRAAVPLYSGSRKIKQGVAKCWISCSVGLYV